MIVFLIKGELFKEIPSFIDHISKSDVLVIEAIELSNRLRRTLIRCAAFCLNRLFHRNHLSERLICNMRFIHRDLAIFILLHNKIHLKIWVSYFLINHVCIIVISLSSSNLIIITIWNYNILECICNLLCQTSQLSRYITYLI